MKNQGRNFGLKSRVSIQERGNGRDIPFPIQLGDMGECRELA